MQELGWICFSLVFPPISKVFPRIARAVCDVSYVLILEGTLGRMHQNAVILAPDKGCRPDPRATLVSSLERHLRPHISPLVGHFYALPDYAVEPD